MRKEIALTALAMIPFSISHANEVELVGIVTAETLNARSGIEHNDKVLFSIKKDDKVLILDINNGWSKIQTKDGKEGWVSSIYIALSENDESYSLNRSSSYTQKQVNTNGLNMRSGPGTSYRVLTTINKGTKLDVISESNGWSKINYNGRVGYVYSIYLDSIQPVYTNLTSKTVNTNGLNVRSGPSTSYGVVASLNKGSKVSVISENNGWSKILYKNKERYVSSRYLDSEKTNSQESSTTTKPTIKETKIVNTEGLNVRKGPSTSYSKLGSLSKGSKVSVISESNGWTKILYKEQEAYVSSMYLDSEKSDSNDTSSDITISTSGIINNVYLNYTLEEQVNKQYNAKANTSNGKYATKEQIEEKLNTNKILSSSSYGKLQFLRVDKYTDGITASEINSFLNKKVSSTNVFYNKGQQFIDAAKKYDIDVVYLVSHCMWETGYGTSTLAKGQTITTYKGQALSKPVVVYNFFGIGAFDGTANLSGGEYAYKQGWTTIDATIDGSAKWIATNYIKRDAYNQNTVYKMKWNNATHQYATDINWCNGVASIMNGLIGYYDDQSKLTYDIIRYK